MKKHQLTKLTEYAKRKLWEDFSSVYFAKSFEAIDTALDLGFGALANDMMNAFLEEKNVHAVARNHFAKPSNERRALYKHHFDNTIKSILFSSNF